MNASLSGSYGTGNLTDDGNVEITGRDLRGVRQETSLHRVA